MSTTNQPKPEWSPVPRPGCHGVQGRVFLKRAGIVVANLKFDECATIDEHTAPVDIDVICIDGAGFYSIEGQVEAIKAGQSTVWPKGKLHQLYTEGSTMQTLMVERLPE